MFFFGSLKFGAGLYFSNDFLLLRLLCSVQGFEQHHNFLGCLKLPG